MIIKKYVHTWEGTVPPAKRCDLAEAKLNFFKFVTFLRVLSLAPRLIWLLIGVLSTHPLKSPTSGVKY